PKTMEEPRKKKKRPGVDDDDGEDVLGKRSRSLGASNETDKSSDDENMTAWLLSIVGGGDEAAASELANLLETTEVTSPAKVRFADFPFSLPLLFQSSSSFVTINGNEESCGSSFSDWESSMMASIDMRGTDIVYRDHRWFGGFSGLFEASGGGACGLDGEVVGRGGSAAVADGDEGCEVTQTNGWDCSDIDDEMLARFLGEDFYE
ncbi:hypothetical protein U1Q18_018038, partial [Sarracenia purpurea var. burkii]